MQCSWGDHPSKTGWCGQLRCYSLYCLLHLSDGTDWMHQSACQPTGGSLSAPPSWASLRSSSVLCCWMLAQKYLQHDPRVVLLRPTEVFLPGCPGFNQLLSRLEVLQHWAEQPSTKTKRMPCKKQCVKPYMLLWILNGHTHPTCLFPSSLVQSLWFTDDPLICIICCLANVISQKCSWGRSLT